MLLQLLPATGAVHHIAAGTRDQHPPQEAALQHAKARQRKTRPGSRTTEPTGPSSNAKSATSPAAPGVAAKARCRGQKRILTDILTRASALNLARLATLGLHHGTAGWAIA